mgnify:CR=1 FL=1
MLYILCASYMFKCNPQQEKNTTNVKQYFNQGTNNFNIFFLIVP